MGSNCPYCSGRRILEGFNDLRTLAPEVAVEWHPTKNGSRTPGETAARTGRKVWWQCWKCSHDWQATVADRVVKGSGCPECYKSTQSRIEESVRNWFVKSPTLECVYPGANARVLVPWRKRKRMDVDVLGQLAGGGAPVVIEYDGSYWHGMSGKAEVDTQKTEALLDAGYLVVRVRSDNLTFLDIAHERLLQVGFLHRHDNQQGFYELCERIEHWLLCNGAVLETA